MLIWCSAELHAAHNQPDMKGMHDIGMPLDEFTDEVCYLRPDSLLCILD